MIVLKCVSRAARKRIRNAPSTAVIAKSSGITVGTSARNSTIRITNAASEADDVADTLRRRRALGLARELDLDARGGRRSTRNWSSTETMPERGSSNPVLSYCTSK